MITVDGISFIMEQDLSTKYTVIPIDNPDHQEKLIKYLEEHKEQKKTSYCRFFLRGLCIMKSECCKFAHDFDQLQLNQIEYKLMHLMECSASEKGEKKKMFNDKTDFHQRPLFFVKQLDYCWLYRYQFTQRYKKANVEPVSQMEINKNQALRHRIRQIMHREEWDKVVAFIEETFPEGNYTIEMFSTWFAKLGFEKAQTFCKFGDFMRYLTCVKGYTEINTIVPPRISRSIFYIKNKTYLHSILDQLIEDSNEYRKAVKKMKEDRLKKMPENIKKRFICRFYMAGNCHQSRETCFYVHSVADMNYHPKQQFLAQYRQPPKSKEDKMNYISLFRYYQDHKKPEDPELTMDDINSKFGHKHEIRRRVHHEVYVDFLDRLRKEHKIGVMPVKWVKEQHQRFGFNHTDENKFGQLQSCLWELGYYNLDIKNQLKEKVSCIAKIPDVEYMDNYFKTILLKILKEQVDTIVNEKKNEILQSSLRRLVYSTAQGNQTETPLHVYLRKKKKNFKEILEELTPQYVEYIFFETTEENYKKLMELVKRYLKKKKSMIHPLEQIDSFIRGLTIDEINMNKFVNYRNLLEFGLLQMGKQIYFWPFLGQALVIDRSLFKSEPKHKHITLQPIHIKKEQHQSFSQYQSQKIVVVDKLESFKYCSLILRSCFKYGVDLEGKLAEKGYIDFIQISCINQRKYIFVIDIWKVQTEQPDLYELIRTEIKELFEDNQRIKIFHACQQDVVALVSCMGILPRPIFDTSGMDIYLQQRTVYKQMYQNNMTYEHTLKRLHHIKTPGLNQVLQTWNAPNGPNQYKERMKKIFHQADRSYFVTRPIIDEFLQYSARDVQDLIQVHEEMMKEDKHEIWLEIGRIYSHLGV